MPTYTLAIPTALQSLGITQQPILNNFQALNDTIDIDHVAMVPNPNSPGNIGKHRQVHLPVKAAAPTAISGEGTLYTKTSTGSQLFYTPDNSTNEYQMTRTISAKFSTFSTLTVYNGATPRVNGGWTFLPGGMLLQYGFIVNPVNNDLITFPVAFTTFGITTLGGVRSDTSDKVISIKDGSITLSQFQIITSGTSNYDILYWQAVGK